jgi:hypothetical protein
MDRKEPKRARTEDDLVAKVTTSEGVTLTLRLKPSATVRDVKEEIERQHGVTSLTLKLYLHDDEREGELCDEEPLRGMRRQHACLEMSMVVHVADAQTVVSALRLPDLVLNDGNGDGLIGAVGVSFVPSQPDWVVVVDTESNQVLVHSIQTGELLTAFGEKGCGRGEFNFPQAVVITADSNFVLVSDCNNARVQVLKLSSGETALLEFVRFLGGGGRDECSFSDEEQTEFAEEAQLFYPVGLGLLPSACTGEEESVIVSDYGADRILHFLLDGTFVGIFAGGGGSGSGEGEFKCPAGISVVPGPLRGDALVAVADQSNHRVQVFTVGGEYKLQFGRPVDWTLNTSTSTDPQDQLQSPTCLASDDFGNMLVSDSTACVQVFSPSGKHLCSRKDLGLSELSEHGIAWLNGDLAITGLAGGVAIWRGR